MLHPQSTYETRAKLWRWTGGKASWYFVTLPAADLEGDPAGGCGPAKDGLRIAEGGSDDRFIDVEDFHLPVVRAQGVHPAGEGRGA